MSKVEHNASLGVGMRGMNECVRQLGGELKLSPALSSPPRAQAVPSLEPDLDSESVMDYQRKRPNLP
jgi:signal transduction histidine kinase